MRLWRVIIEETVQHETGRQGKNIGEEREE